MNSPCFPSRFAFGSRSLDLRQAHVMGILNVTPDSFSDGGELLQGGRVALDEALYRAQAMVEAGAAILDVGGESTRPGAAPVSVQEEVDRVVSLVEALCARLDVIVSVDTSTPEVMRESASRGAGLINDVRALERPGALAAAAASTLPVCLMHMRGQPATMQVAPHYEDVTREVGDYLLARAEQCLAAGLERARLLLDPGFGFGKDLGHNLELLARLERLQALEFPLLVGMSRKRMLGALTGKEAKERVAAGVAAHVVAVMKGARIVRTHDVAETADALKVCSALLGR